MTLTGAGERPTKTAIRRPASGVVIDPAKLTGMRDKRSMTRLQLSQRTYMLAHGDPENKKGVSRDAIAKIENGQRNPKTGTLSELCDALQCKPADLLPDPPPLWRAKAIPVEALDLPAGVTRALKGCEGVSLAGDVAEMSEQVLLEVRGIGPDAVITIREALAAVGLAPAGNEREE